MDTSKIEFAITSLRSRLLQLRETLIFQFSFTPEAADKVMERLNETLRYTAGIDVVGGSYDPTEENTEESPKEPLDAILERLGKRGERWHMTKDEDFGHYAYYSLPNSPWVDARGYGVTEEDAIRDLDRDIKEIDYEWDNSVVTNWGRFEYGEQVRVNGRSGVYNLMDQEVGGLVWVEQDGVDYGVAEGDLRLNAEPFGIGDPAEYDDGEETVKGTVRQIDPDGIVFLDDGQGRIYTVAYSELYRSAVVPEISKEIAIEAVHAIFGDKDAVNFDWSEFSEKFVEEYRGIFNVEA